MSTFASYIVLALAVVALVLWWMRRSSNKRARGR
jgi:hypothetical protein